MVLKPQVAARTARPVKDNQKESGAGHGKIAVKEVATRPCDSLDDESNLLARDLRLLRAILQPNTNAKSRLGPAKRPKTGQPASRSRANTIVKVSKPLENDNVRSSSNELSIVEQKKFAIDSFNKSLKSLSFAAKQRQEHRREPQHTDSTEVVSSSRAASTKDSQILKQHDVQLNVECACAALDILRLQDTGDTYKSEERLKRENGAITFLDKLNTFELTEKALYQASRINDQYWQQPRAGRTSRLNEEQYALHELLLKPSVPTSKGEFDFVCAYQCQVLRLAILREASMLNFELVDATELTASGSPGQIVLAGVGEGYIDHDKAARNLLTIAQALTKLYANLSKSSCDGNTEKARISLHLLRQALSHRIKAFHMLGKSDKVETDVFPVLENCIRRVWSAIDNDEALYESTRAAIACLRNELKELRIKQQFPTSLLKYLAILAEQNNDKASAEKWLVNLASVTHGLPHIVCLCQIACLSITSGTDDSDSISRAYEALSNQTDPNLSSDALLTIVRLRKACAQVLISSPSSTQSTISQEHHLESRCLRTLYIIFKFLRSRVSNPDAKLSQSIHLAVLKTVEAIVDAERITFPASEDVLTIFLSQIQICVAFVHCYANADTIPPLQSEVLISLKIKLSNVLWRAHLIPAISNRGHEKVRELASQSIDCLDGLSKDELGRAALGPRLEKLATLYIEEGKAEYGKAALERAVKHYISNDALANAVEASLTKQSGQVWSDTASLSSQLGRALQSLNSLEPPKDGGNFFDDSTLPDAHRAVLLEAQIVNMSKKRLMGSEAQVILEKLIAVLELASTPPYYVWQLRLLSVVTHCLSRSRNFSEIDREKLGELLEKSLSHTLNKPGSFLMSYSTSLRCVVLIQKFLLTNCPSRKSAREDILQLLTVLKAQSQEYHSLIDDADILISSLRSLADKEFATASYADAAACLELQLVLASNGLNVRGEDNFDCYVTLAQCRTRLDDVVTARSALENARTISSTRELSFERQISTHVTAAEIELNACDTKSCRKHLHEAAAVFARMQTNRKNMKSTERLRRDSIVATAALLSSRLALQDGELHLAVRFARQAAKICVSIWTALQKTKPTTTTPSRDDESTMTSLLNNISNLEIVGRSAGNSSLAQSHLIWTYTNMYIDSLCHAADLFAHCGLFEDAIYYHEQLRKVRSVDTFDQDLSKAQSMYAKLLAFSGASGLAMEQSRLALSSNTTSIVPVNIAETYIRIGQIEKAQELSTKITQHKKNTQASSRDFSRDHDKEEPSNPKRKVLARNRATKAVAKQKALVSNIKQDAKLDDFEKVHKQLQSWNQLKEEDVLQALVKEISIATQKAALRAEGPLESENVLCSQPRFLVNNILSTARMIFERAWHQLRTNSMQSVLADSALALPVKSRNKRCRGRISLLQSDRKAKSSLISPSHHSPDRYEQQQNDVVSQFQAAQRLCEVLLRDRRQYCSTPIVNIVARLEARISLLLSTMDRPFTVSTTELVIKAALPLDEALDREMMVSDAEGLTADREALSNWPNESDSRLGSALGELGSRLDELPHSWIVISINLAETKDELVISKIISGNEPFLVRIPLHRSNEGEIADFGFREAVNEMKDIIKRANESSHDERGAGDKQSRLVWHREREDLNERLQVLLQNIESVWLGGFRGMFSPRSSARATKTFGNLLDQALDKHLPSRQRSSNVHERTVVHDEVLDLFLGLVNSEDEDLDDATMDLLYFVVDVLQFSGEHNAYDEIDWDALLVDTLNAIRACHESARSRNDCHTILVIDKELECIPWESLPCLIECPTSRMPSIGTIFERLDHIRKQSDDACAISISTTTATSSYVLNPAGNLMSTQERLEPILKSLTLANSCTAITNMPPSETEMSKLLSESDVLLYFGHGSGAQYIRPRTIRALPRCATTFLFGCSSAKMTEHGDFESTGMPRAYMLGHSPAVVGCLWDVMDREIDRVAVRTLSEWGLVNSQDTKVQEILSRTKSKSKPAIKKTEALKVDSVKKTLVEAVRDGRKAAMLRYLCGAAVVVYGIPVILD